MADTSGSSLKRLGFVQGYAQQAATLTESLYKTVRGYVPGFVEPYYGEAENLAATYGAPYLTWAQDTGDKFLKTIDSQLDGLANGAGGALNYSRDLHGKNMSTFNAAKSQYFGIVESLVNSVKAKLDPSPYVQKAVDTGKVVGEKAAVWVDPDKVVDLGVDYYKKAASYGPAPKIISTVEPYVPLLTKYYTAIHDVLVSNALYKSAWELVFSTATKAQEFPLVKKAVDVGYPIAAPFYDPVAANFTKSKYLKQLEEHLKPVAA